MGRPIREMGQTPRGVRRDSRLAGAMRLFCKGLKVAEIYGRWWRGTEKKEGYYGRKIEV